VSNTETSTTAATGRRTRSIRASRPLMGWRTVDLLTITFLGAAFGIAYWAWGLLYQTPSEAVSAVFPPLAGLVVGPWFLAGVVGGLVVRRPGAAFLAEVLAAVVSMLPGTKWGIGTLLAGIFQGVGAEIAFAVLGYGAYGLGAAVLAGVLSAPIEIVYEWYTYYPDWSFPWQLAYLGATMVSGAVIAGAGGWLLTRALARAGALNAFPPGQEARERHAV
jgi:energy-coupling factor transport system permease protein